MKKIFIPVLTLLIAGLASPSYGAWGANFRHGNHHGSNSLFSSDSDGYWLNRWRSYKKYPINFYSQRLLNKDSGEKSKTIDAHEYKRGVAVTARIGQRMYDSTTYTITTRTGSEQYRATETGSMYGGQNEIKITKGQIFTPLGETKINGEYYILFEVPETSHIIAADYKGYFLDALGLIEDGFLYVSKDIVVSRPHNLHIEPYREVEENTGEAKLDFEIKYGGIQGGDMSFVVSDGTDEGKRKYAPLDEKIVQVNGVNFEIIHASPDYIEYKILEPMPAPEQPEK